MVKKLATSLFLILFVVSQSTAGHSQNPTQEVSVKMIGGQFRPSAAGGEVTFIFAQKFSCSGVLVGRREVLTAAHCVSAGIKAADYAVFAAGAWRRVASIWHHPKYVAGQPPLSMARYDVGVIVLSEPVTDLSPLPILKGKKVTRGTTIAIAGYGTNELSSDENRSFIDNFKVGLSRVMKADGNHLFANHQAYQTSACQGDSGGPAIMQYKKGAFAVVGVVSAGINRVENNQCVLRGDGLFVHPDLQSSSSRSFLSAFRGIRYARVRSSRSR
jgi:V8-like Glu-specific endopeptidase